MGSSTMMTQEGLVAEVDRLLHDNRPTGIKPEIIVDDPAIDLIAGLLVRNMIVDVVIPNLFAVGTHNGDDVMLLTIGAHRDHYTGIITRATLSQIITTGRVSTVGQSTS